MNSVQPIPRNHRGRDSRQKPCAQRLVAGSPQGYRTWGQLGETALRYFVGAAALVLCTAATDTVPISSSYGLVIQLGTTSCQQLVKSMPDAKHKAEVHIEMGKRTAEMTCEEFERRIFSSSPKAFVATPAAPGETALDRWKRTKADWERAMKMDEESNKYSDQAIRAYLDAEEALKKSKCSALCPHG